MPTPEPDGIIARLAMCAKSMTVQALADLVGGKVEGDPDACLEGMAAIDAAGPRELTFAVDDRRLAALADSKAGAAIVPESDIAAPMPLIHVADVPGAVGRILAAFAGPEDLPTAGVDSSAVVAADARVADDAAVGPGVVVGSRASVGAGSVLCARVVLGADVRIGSGTVLFEGAVVRQGCVVGDRVRIGPNSVIGFDGFGYHTAGGVHHRIPHAGNVVIEDDVEIGACACVDRAKFGSTRICAGAKIDNLVQIAHNVVIDKGCLVAAQVGIAGSTLLGKYVVVGGHTGIHDNIEIGDGAHVAAFAAVAHSLDPGQTVAGVPALPGRDFWRQYRALAKLPELVRRVNALESRLSEREPPDNH